MSETIERNFDSVWVIEAPGKIKQMTAILQAIGYHPWIIATRGHFMKMPDTLADSGIDADLNEVARIADAMVVENLRAAASHPLSNNEDFRGYFVATDADTEGDVIAVDVYDVIKEQLISPIRIRLKGMDKDSVLTAIDEGSPIYREDATPGRTRAIIDRLIGSGFAAQGIGAGRIRSAILGIVSRGGLSLQTLCLNAPSDDGPATWSVKADINDSLTYEIAEQLLSIRMPALHEEKKEFIVGKPLDMGGVLVKAGDVMDISPHEAATAMQSAYESGRMSYPRSDAHGLSPSAIAKVSSSFQKTGQQFARRIVPIKSISDVHDSPYPIGEFNVNHDPEAVGTSEGIRIIVGREILKSGQQRKTSYHAKGIIKKFLIDNGFDEKIAEYVDNLTWTRDFGPKIPGETHRPGISSRRPDTVLLEACLDAELGRPSTYANHIKNIMESGLVDNTLALTEEGKRLLAKTPSIMLDPNLSKAIEAACKISIMPEPGKEPWQELASRIVSQLPAQISAVMTSAMETPGKRKAQDYTKKPENTHQKGVAAEQKAVVRPQAIRPSMER